MADREVGTYREGDLIRATKGDTVVQGRLEMFPTSKVLGLVNVGWQLDSLKSGRWIIELIEPAPDPLPTEPGYYLVTFDNDERVWEFGNGDWFEVNTNPNTYTKPEGFLKIERLYTKAEVMAKARTSAFEADPDYLYGGPDSDLLKNLEGNL